MRIAYWLAPGIWLALLMSLGILLYTNAKNNAVLTGDSFSLASRLNTLTVVTSEQRTKITLRKRFTVGENKLLRALASYFGAVVDVADTYQLELPVQNCEFSAGLLVHCDSATSKMPMAEANLHHAVSWWYAGQLSFRLTSQQPGGEGLAFSFRTSRAKKSVLNTAGETKNQCILQAHLQLSLNKSAQQSASMNVEDVFFTLSDQACVS